MGLPSTQYPHPRSPVLAIITGTAKKNKLVGTADADSIFGLGGDDTLYGGNGADKLYGGISNDALGRQGRGHPTIENLTHLGGSNFTGTGNALANVITGGTGANTLNGGGGDDGIGLIGVGGTAYGGAGNDVIQGGAGADVMYGGDGNDTASYAGASSGVTASLQGGLGTVGAAAGDTYFGIKNLTGSAFADTLTGDAGNNVITGGGLADELRGGGGADRFVYLSVNDETDTIFDFNQAEGDTIDASAFAGTFTFVEGDLGLYVGGGTPSIRFLNILPLNITQIGFDVNGDTSTNMVLRLSGTITLHAADFIL